MKIVIEDYYGNDLCSFFAHIDSYHLDNTDCGGLLQFKNCDIADKDIDENGVEYIRIQLTNPLIAEKV